MDLLSWHPSHATVLSSHRMQTAGGLGSAEVVLLKKLGKNLVNGSRGVVESLDNGGASVRFDNGVLQRVDRSRGSKRGTSGRVLRTPGLTMTVPILSKTSHSCCHVHSSWQPQCHLIIMTTIILVLLPHPLNPLHPCFILVTAINITHSHAVFRLAHALHSTFVSVTTRVLIIYTCSI